MQSFFLKLTSKLAEAFPESIRNKFTPENILYRIINIIIFSFLMSFYTYIPFLVYMNHYGFFSYDLFNYGSFAINIMSIYIVFFLITFSMIFSLGFGIAITYSLNKYKMPKWNWFIISFNIFIILLFILFIYSNFEFTETTFNRISWLLFLLIVSIPICIHIALTFCIFTSVKSQLISTFLTFCIILPITFFSTFEAQTSRLTSIAFKIFSIGSNLPIKIEDKTTDYIYKGKLVFLSPDYIFFNNEENEKVILERKNKDIIFLKN